jgi:hypothetical protein
MKARPRHAENRAAEILSDVFQHYGFSPIQRQPIIGRTGPDFTMNELKLAIDIKSRLEVPISYLRAWPVHDDRFLCCPLFLLDQVIHEFTGSATYFTLKRPSRLVAGYYDHQDEWTKRECPDAITAIILHRPKLPYGRAVFVISKQDQRRLQKRWLQ